VLGSPSESTLAQPFNEIIAIPSTTTGSLQHLALNGIGALQVFKPLSNATRALACLTEVKDEQGDGERSKGVTRRSPRPWPG